METQIENIAETFRGPAFLLTGKKLIKGWTVAEYGENPDGTPKNRCLKLGGETVADFGKTGRDICDYVLAALLSKAKEEDKP